MVDIKSAQEVLRRYKAGKSNLERRIVDNEQWFKLRHWEQAAGSRSKNPGDPEYASAWLLNCITNKHADAMDNYPEPVILPREEGDRAAAEQLSAIIPTVLEMQRYEDTYDRMWWRKLKSGTGVTGVYWDKSAHNGLGDVAVKSVDVLNLYWEPGVDDIQASRNIFYVSLMDNDLLQETYPQLSGKLGGGEEITKYIYDDSVDTSDKSMVVDWYYKRKVGTRTVVHYCKYVGDDVLYASEEDEELADVGFYAHGKYPFVIDTMFRVEGSPAGFGWLDVCKDPQLYIDKLNQVLLKNAIVGARRRWWVRADAGVNEAEYADTNKEFVHYNGSNPQDSIMPIEQPELSGMYPAILASKVDELKETSGNRDFSQGGTTSGVTAASAIAALQEAGSKLSRDMIRSSYRAFSDVCWLVLELIRQFYTEDRKFRITGTSGEEQFVTFNASMIAARTQGTDFGQDMGYERPEFDIKVRAQKRNAFATAAQNEMAKEFYGAGFFDPMRADQALAALEMMDFEGKAQVQQRIQQNGTLYEQVQKLAQMVDTLTGGALSGGAAGGTASPSPAPTQAQNEALENGRLAANSREALAAQARERAQNVTGVK